MMEKIKKAKEIVISDLRSCYREEGILASGVNFDDFWARDSFWASFGLIEIETDLEQVEKSLLLFLKYQRKDGKIPRKIVLDYNGFKYLGLKIKRKKPRPIYTSSIKWFFSMDDNLLLVIAFCKYIEKTKDIEFAEKYFDQVRQTLDFFQNRNLLKNSLIYEIGFGNWEDTIYKWGNVLYTNCLWFEAVRYFEKLCSNITETPRRSVFTSANVKIPASKKIKTQIQKTFWLEDKGYFADSVRHNVHQEYFDLAGNVLAIIFDIADREQTKKILNLVETRFIMSEKDNNKNILHAINYPRYPWYKISPVLYLFGIQDYQNGISWSWIEALLAAACIKQGKIKEGQKYLGKLSEIITKNGHIHETYYLDGRTFDHLFWKSAVPFAWGAGLMLWTISKLEKEAS